jgi:hypothetical protein
LHGAGLINLWPERVYQTTKNTFEFVAVLRKGGEAVYSDGFLPAIEADRKAPFEDISNQLRATNTKLEAANAAALAAEQTLTRMKKSLAWRATKPFRT